MLDNLPDIIERCLSGDSRAQAKLYKAFASKMYGICLRYSRDSDEAKDVLQEGFIRVFNNLAGYRGTGSFEGWVRRIMINTALEKYRKNKNIFLLEDNEAREIEVPGEIHENISAKELVKMIQELSPQYRMVFNLYALEGYSHKEISQMLDISEGTSKSNLSRARAILQGRLQMYKKLKF